MGFRSNSSQELSSSRWWTNKYEPAIETVYAEASRPKPHPDNYTIIRHKEFSSVLVIEIKYHDCDNYEGRKILLFRNCNMEQLEKQKLIDPHFLEHQTIIHPTARFEPTEYGWKLAVHLAYEVGVNGL